MEIDQMKYSVVIVGGTPAGLCAGIAAARDGAKVVVLERTAFPGGLCANGLGATDIGTRGATRGLFLVFIEKILAHYKDTYGPDSEQVKVASEGYHFEPSVASRVLAEMVAAEPNLTVLTERQFDADPVNVVVEGAPVNPSSRKIRVTHRPSGREEWYQGQVLIDATYEGDLAAACGASYRLGREDAREFKEPLAGVIYKGWDLPVAEGSTGLGDNAIQAYNYRLCLTRDPSRRVPVSCPPDYRREEYLSLVEDVRANRWTGPTGREKELDGIGRIVNIVELPNGKTDANNQHLSFLSTDLPEENWPWPSATWEWRDRFATRLRHYTLGLLWFCQNDESLPLDFREKCREWGLAADEYQDNQHFPRQVYVREGRRINGRYRLTAFDTLPPAKSPDGRPPIHPDSITASDYALDSHAVRKREPGRPHLEGFFNSSGRPYTVPYGVIVPADVEGLLVPVAASASHIGFSTLRMEPCWMALGEAAGTAAAMAVKEGVQPAAIKVAELQDELLNHGAVLVYFRDTDPSDSDWREIQKKGLASELTGWYAREKKG